MKGTEKVQLELKAVYWELHPAGAENSDANTMHRDPRFCLQGVHWMTAWHVRFRDAENVGLDGTCGMGFFRSDIKHRQSTLQLQREEVGRVSQCY